MEDKKTDQTADIIEDIKEDEDSAFFKFNLNKKLSQVDNFTVKELLESYKESVTLLEQKDRDMRELKKEYLDLEFKYQAVIAQRDKFFRVIETLETSAKTTLNTVTKFKPILEKDSVKKEGKHD